MIRSSKGGSNGQVEYSTEEGGEPKRGEAGTRDQAKNTPQRNQAAASQGRQERRDMTREGRWRSDGSGGGDFGVALHVTVELNG